MAHENQYTTGNHTRQSPSSQSNGQGRSMTAGGESQQRSASSTSNAQARHMSDDDTPRRTMNASGRGNSNPGNFANNREKAREAGRKGGQQSGGNFANDPARAAEAGRKGGQRSHGGGSSNY